MQAALHESAEFGLGQKKTADPEITEHSGRTQLSHPASQLLALSLRPHLSVHLSIYHFVYLSRRDGLIKAFKGRLMLHSCRLGIHSF